jgi:hypothetical protein
MLGFDKGIIPQLGASRIPLKHLQPETGVL